MAELGTYSVNGTTGSVASWFSNVDNLLTGLVDNESGAIKARNIRDSVYSLWQKIDTLAATVSVSATVSVDYNRSQASTVAVGGLPIGSTFSGTIQNVLDRILYPYIAPSGSISPSAVVEYGNPSYYNFSLSWSVTKNSNSITTIIVNGLSQTPTGNSQTGPPVPAVGTHSVSLPPVTTTNTYNLTVGDGTSTSGASTTLSWRNKIYWGKIDLTSIGNPNLTTSPGSIALVSGFFPNSAKILSLSGAGANGLPDVSSFPSAPNASQLATSKSKTYTNINGGGQYLIFAWPSNMGSAYTPVFTVNGLPNSAFTRVKTNWAFTNQYGFSGSNYEVWISNTAQNSPLTIVVT